MVKHFFDRLQMHSQFLLYVYLYCEARWLLFATIEEEPMHLFFSYAAVRSILLLDGQLYMTDRLRCIIYRYLVDIAFLVVYI